MAWSKLAEMFAEAIPAGLLQMYAFILSPNRSLQALASIIVSALATGFGSALISYGEFITAKLRRAKHTPLGNPLTLHTNTVNRRL